MQVDYLIIGQGISGTLLGRALMKEGKKVMVIDDGNAASSSKVAAGVINPVTGKRLVKTWMIEQLQPFAWDTYKAIESELGISLVSNCNILDFHLTRDAAQVFNERAETERAYLHTVEDEEFWTQYFRFNYGIGEIAPCMLVDIRAMLSAWRKVIISGDSLLETTFMPGDCIIKEDGVSYNDINAGKIIFCDGAVCADNPWFNKLPWSKDKGEALIASIPGLPANNIYKQGIHIVPWQDGLFWIGATHDWKYTDMQPSLSFRKQVEEHLAYWLKLPYTITDHIVAARPVNVERRPFIGFHPLMPSIGICNGMGAKGCSVAPYFIEQFARHLVHATPLMPEVDIKRFARILARQTGRNHNL